MTTISTSNMLKITTTIELVLTSDRQTNILTQTHKIYKNSYSDEQLDLKDYPQHADNPLTNATTKRLQPQLLLATQPCIRTCQGQHYRHDIACLEQEFYFAPSGVWFKSDGHSLVAVKTILPIQKFYYMCLKLNKLTSFKSKINEDAHPELITKADLSLTLTHLLRNMATTPWNFNLRRVTIVAPKAGRFPRRNARCCVFHLGSTLPLSFLHIMLSSFSSFLIYIYVRVCARTRKALSLIHI